ncbi:MAG: GFA family protein [Pseudomonadota bacterium]
MNADEQTGGCYCGNLRYAITSAPTLKAQCHCRTCQHIAGGGPNYFMLVPPDGFTYTKGTARQFTRDDLENAVTRDFCARCGTHILSRRPGLKELVIKVGTLDDPASFGGPKIAIFTEDIQPFHHIAEDVTAFEKLPERG